MAAMVRPWLIWVAVLTASACGASEPVSGSFASAAGVLGCADLVAWGTVDAASPVRDGLEVTFDVDEWVIPATGSDGVTFLADDPAKEVAAPGWEATGRVLVIVSDAAPAARYSAADGERAVRQWRDAGSPRPPREQCERA